MHWSLNLTISTKHREWKLLEAITNDCVGDDASPAWGRTVHSDGSQRIGLGPVEIAIEPSLERRLANVEAARL